MQSTYSRFGFWMVGVFSVLCAFMCSKSALAEKPIDHGALDLNIDFEPQYIYISSPLMRQEEGEMGMGLRGTLVFGSRSGAGLRLGIGSGWSRIWSQGLAPESNTSVWFDGSLTAIVFQLELKLGTPWRFISAGVELSTGGSYLSGVWRDVEESYSQEVDGWAMTARAAFTADALLTSHVLLRGGLFCELNDFVGKKDLRYEPLPIGVKSVFVVGLVTGVTWRSIF